MYDKDVESGFIQKELVFIYCQELSSHIISRNVLDGNPLSPSKATAALLRLTVQQKPVDEGKPWSFQKKKSKYTYKWKDDQPVCYKCK